MIEVTLSKKTPVVMREGRLRAYARSSVDVPPNTVVQDETGQQWESVGCYGEAGKFLVKLYRDPDPSVLNTFGTGKSRASF